MFGKLLLLFIGLPLLELAILVKLGEIFGLWPTISLVVVTGFIGAALAKQQGFRAWMRIQNELGAGRIPASELVDGLLILVGGIVLLTPGLLTDLCGFALLIPAFRSFIKQKLQKKFTGMVQTGQTKIYVRGETKED